MARLIISAGDTTNILQDEDEISLQDMLLTSPKRCMGYVVNDQDEIIATKGMSVEIAEYFWVNLKAELEEDDMLDQ